MGAKRRNSFQFNWQATTPVPYNVNTPLSGVLLGVMTGTNTIYSNIQDISNTDNQGLEITWTGTPTGTLSVLVSESGKHFYAYPSLSITQPSGSASGGPYNLNQVPWRYILLTYVNVSGTGTLEIWIGSKDLN